MSERRPEDLRAITAFCCVLLGALLGTAWALSIMYHFELTPGTGTMQMTYAELAATLLAAVGVIVAVMAIGMAILAVVGFRQIRQRAVDVVTKRIEAELSEQGNLRKRVEEVASRDAVAKVEEELKEKGVIRGMVQASVDKILGAAQSGLPETPENDVEKKTWGNKDTEFGDEE